MIVALDVANFFSGLTNGTPIYLYNLIRALIAEDADLDVRLLYHHWMNDAARQILSELEGDRVEVVQPSILSTLVPPGGWYQVHHPHLRRFLGSVDVFHGGDFLRPGTTGVPTVVTIHDLSTLHYPQHHTRLNRLRDRWKLRWAVREADLLIAVSEATRNDLVTLFSVDPHRVAVVHEARGHASIPALSPNEIHDVRARYSFGDGPIILTVGTIEPRKNHVRLVRAFDALASGHRSVQLVIAGGKGWKAEPVYRAIEQSAAADRIHAPGFVPEEDLQALYGVATIFAYPSVYEGFGLPVLEAMAAGVPVLTSNVSSLPEVAGDAALLVDPRSVDAIRKGLARLLNEPATRRRLGAAGREREKSFTWDKTARETLAVYRMALGREDR